MALSASFGIWATPSSTRPAAASRSSVPPTVSSRGSRTIARPREALTRARAAALFHVLDEVEHGLPGGLRVMRLAGGAIWALGNEEHKTVLEGLGRAADELASRAILASPARPRAAWPKWCATRPLLRCPPSPRRACGGGESARGAVDAPRDLPSKPPARARPRAERDSPHQRSSAGDNQKRVLARYPEAAPLPERPELDALLLAHGLVWDDPRGQYLRAGEGQRTSHATTGPEVPRLPTASTGVPRSMEPEAIQARAFDERLRTPSIAGFSAFSASSPTRASRAALMLARRVGTEPTSLDAELIGAMKRQMAKLGVDPNVVYEADRQGPAGSAWPNLLHLAELAAAEVADRLLPPETARARLSGAARALQAHGLSHAAHRGFQTA